MVNRPVFLPLTVGHLQCFRPSRCVLCGQRYGVAAEPVFKDLCRGCHDDLLRVTGPCCHCGMPVPGPIGETARVCAACTTEPLFAYCVAGFDYAYPADQLIQAFKFRKQLAAGHALIRLLPEIILEQYRRDSVSLPELMVPVPLHFVRRLRRGFNQADEIAGVLSRQLGLPVARALRRTVATPPQSALSRKERGRNLQHAFRVTRPRLIEGATVALVDDVVTTGSTLQAAAAKLAAAGAAQVHVWLLARTC